MMKPISTRIDNRVFAAFEKICRETHIPKSHLIEEGIGYVIQKYSDLDKKLELVQAIGEAEEDLKKGRVISVEELGKRYGYSSAKRK